MARQFVGSRSTYRDAWDLLEDFRVILEHGKLTPVHRVDLRVPDDIERRTNRGRSKFWVDIVTDPGVPIDTDAIARECRLRMARVA